MIQRTAVTLRFYAFYTESKVGKTGLTVTVDVYENGSAIVTGGSATEIGGGLYSYTLASGSNDANGEYAAIFKTATTTVDAQHIPSLWVTPAWADSVDAAVSTRASQATADAIEADTQDIQGTVDALDGRIPTSLVGGRMDASVGAMEAGTVTAAAIATGAVDADALAADAVAEIAAGISVPTAAAVADAVLDEALSGHTTSGSAGEALGRLDDIQARTDLITAGAITIAAPLDPETQAITAVRGDDLTVTFTSEDWPDLTGATVRMTARVRPRTSNGLGVEDGDDPVVFTLADTGADREAGTGAQSVTFHVLPTPGDPVVNEQEGGTEDMPTGRNACKYDVEAVLDGGPVYTLALGVIHVTEDQTRGGA